LILRQLQLINFRNYQNCWAEWHEQINLLQGANAQGKTNLLEAICFLSLATSFRAVGEFELIFSGKDYFFVEGDIDSQEKGNINISAAYSRDKKRKWKINGNECLRNELIGLLHTVIFSPEDVNLIKASPMQRRRFLNRQISQLFPQHCQELIRYNRILAQRNSCLRFFQQMKANNDLQEALDVWDQQLAASGAAIIWQRRQVLQQLNPLAAEIHEKLAVGEKLNIRYKSFTGALEANSKEEIQALFLKELKRLSGAERSRGATLVGPHRDDLLIEINKTLGKGYASQGQQRTAALSCKLAELELARNQKHEWPVLLLDDVLSELDDYRQQALLNKIAGGAQTFIASTNPLPKITGQIWHITTGSINKRGGN